MAIFELHINKRSTGVTVRPDTVWSGMWRVHRANGDASDMLNLRRAKDAAISIARPRGLGGSEIARWRIRETAQDACTARFVAEAA